MPPQVQVQVAYNLLALVNSQHILVQLYLYRFLNAPSLLLQPRVVSDTEEADFQRHLEELEDANKEVSGDDDEDEDEDEENSGDDDDGDENGADTAAGAVGSDGEN